MMKQEMNLGQAFLVAAAIWLAIGFVYYLYPHPWIIFTALAILWSAVRLFWTRDDRVVGTGIESRRSLSDSHMPNLRRIRLPLPVPAILPAMPIYCVKGFDEHNEELFDERCEAPNAQIAQLYILAALRRSGFPRILQAEKAKRFEVKKIR